MITLNDELFLNPFMLISNQLTEIKFLKNEIDQTMKSKQNKLLELVEENLNNKFLSATNFSCYNPYTNQLTILGHKKETIDSRIDTLNNYYNKQCLWLLVESYELFDKYLKNLYDELIIVDDSFKIQKKNSKEILKKFRTKISDFKKLEINNNLGIDFRLMIVFYSKIRHLSVHEGGIVPDKELFIKKVLEEANISSKKEYSQYISQKVDDFFENDMLILKTIHFREKNELGINIEVNTDRFNNLLGRLGSYIYMIQIEVLKYSLEQMGKEKINDNR